MLTFVYESTEGWFENVSRFVVRNQMTNYMDWPACCSCCKAQYP
jgi:hypothetical protein